MKRIVLMLCLGLVAMGLGAYFRKPKPAPASNVAVHERGAADIETARAQARASLPAFWAAREAQAPGTEKFMLKVAFPMDAGGGEHIWVTDISTKGDGRYEGRLGNDPQFIKDRRFGDLVSFGETQVSDWMFLRFGKIVGNETARPLIARMPKKEAQTYLARFEKP